MVERSEGCLVSIIVPTLNEAQNIDELLGRLIEAFRREGRSFEIVVADGGSTDGTREKVEAWSARDPVRFVSAKSGRGLAKEGERWLKVPQIGGVTIGDDVEIGANTTIDRGPIDDTVIEHGVKLDNQIQVAHNVRIGAHTAIAACVGIAGSANIGARCTIGGAAVVLGHLTVVDDVHITAMSLVTQSITDPGVYSSGTPLEPNASWHRNFVRFKQLDDMAKRLKTMERELDKLKERLP